MDRRDFLKYSASAAATVLLSSVATANELFTKNSSGCMDCRFHKKYNIRRRSLSTWQKFVTIKNNQYETTYNGSCIGLPDDSFHDAGSE